MSIDAEKKICSACGREIELAVKSYPLGSAFQLKRLHADIYRCPACRRVELFEAESDMVTCPVCGVAHPTQERCVSCALDTAFGGWEARKKHLPEETPNTERKD